MVIALIIFHALGWFLTVSAVGIFIFKMTIVYDVAGDPMGGGGVPTLDAVIVPPLIGPLAIRAILLAPPVRHGDSGNHWPFWIWLTLWLGLTVLAILVYAIVDRLGHRQLARNTKAFNKMMATKKQ